MAILRQILAALKGIHETLKDLHATLYNLKVETSRILLTISRPEPYIPPQPAVPAKAKRPRHKFKDMVGERYLYEKAGYEKQSIKALRFACERAGVIYKKDGHHQYVDKADAPAVIAELIKIKG